MSAGYIFLNGDITNLKKKKKNLKLKLAAMDKKYLKLKTQWMKVTLDKIR